MTPIIIVLIFLLILCLIKIKKYEKQKTLRNHICFCCAKDNSKHRYSISLFGHILNIQNDLKRNIKISEKHCLVNDDKCHINEILQKHQDFLLQVFFDGVLDNNIDRLSKLSHQDFLMLYLWSFLRDEHNFNFEKMFSFGEIPDGENYRELHLTNFSLAYYKLLYIAQLYCHNSANIIKQFPDLCYENLAGTKEIIDSKIKKFYR